MCLGIPAQVLSLEEEGDSRSGVVSFSGLKKKIDLSFVPEVKLGDYVICHVGIAIGIIDEKQAHETIATLKSLGQLEI